MEFIHMQEKKNLYYIHINIMRFKKKNISEIFYRVYLHCKVFSCIVVLQMKPDDLIIKFVSKEFRDLKLLMS